QYFKSSTKENVRSYVFLPIQNTQLSYNADSNHLHLFFTGCFPEKRIMGKKTSKSRGYFTVFAK
ncbi:MAG: hypothetical protein ORN54_11575, partial [Cyclobacteriaceae bacterium]|nr:hypothetical protein [Cyclobacteriaceae bacterium]